MWHDDLNLLVPTPRHWRRQAGIYPLGDAFGIHLAGQTPRAALGPLLFDDLGAVLATPVEWVEDETLGDATIELTTGGPRLPAGGYSLTVSGDGLHLAAPTPQGLFYGGLTMVQLVAMGRAHHGIPLGEILDWPAHGQRWAMLDLGRATWTLPRLKQAIRILARLRYNGLHLHLHDNELNAVTYADTPLGMENPYALALADYADLIDEAASYHIEVIPEVEPWGHAGSILQHYPHLYGASCPHGYGHSFGIGPATFELLDELYDQWFDILPDNAWFHVGLDEANWRLLPDADPVEYNRQALVRQVYERVQAAAGNYGKHARMVMWGANAGGEDVYIPPDLRAEIVVEPWHAGSAANVREILARCRVPQAHIHTADGRLACPMLAAGGASASHELGAVLATQAWAHGTRDWPWFVGVDVALWGTNDLAGRLISLYCGAHSAWNPTDAAELLDAEVAPWEETIGRAAGQMRLWQGLFADTAPDAVGLPPTEEVAMGMHRWGPRRGQAVAPIWMPERMQPGNGDG